MPLAKSALRLRLADTVDGAAAPASTSATVGTCATSADRAPVRRTTSRFGGAPRSINKSRCQIDPLALDVQHNQSPARARSPYRCSGDQNDVSQRKTGNFLFATANSTCYVRAGTDAPNPKAQLGHFIVTAKKSMLHIVPLSAT